MLKKQLIPLSVMAVLSLWVTFGLPVPIEVHFSVRIMMCIAALYPMFAAWTKLKTLDKIILTTTAIIYNPIFLIQLGSGLAWGTVALLLLIYSFTRMLSRGIA
jgi:hypothetical protein|tara:strand:- start:963 stop:1271 length:309 start_codon:yes stop_codon:yes gene_type:complete